jgi:hypothetical protein
MKIERVEEGTKCNWCGEPSNGWEEMFIDSDVDGDDPAYYHLRCLGKMFVLRIEGVLPVKIFNAAVEELNSSVVLQDIEEEHSGEEE